MLKYVCVRDVMDVVFSVCIVRRRAVGVVPAKALRILFLLDTLCYVAAVFVE